MKLSDNGSFPFGEAKPKNENLVCGAVQFKSNIRSELFKSVKAVIFISFPENADARKEMRLLPQIPTKHDMTNSKEQFPECTAI